MKFFFYLLLIFSFCIFDVCMFNVPLWGNGFPLALGCTAAKQDNQIAMITSQLPLHCSTEERDEKRTQPSQLRRPSRLNIRDIAKIPSTVSI
uniref:Putative secreted protein n=1 Tax=Ixodes ricinus TaxID=34613 RepID=A0A6B0UH18_IXORI